MGILKATTIAVSAAGAAGSATGNNSSEVFVGEIIGIAVNYDANAPVSTDLIVSDARTGVEILRLNNTATDVYKAPRAAAVDAGGVNIASGTNGLWAVPYTVDRGVRVDVAEGNSITNHCVVTVFYRK